MHWILVEREINEAIEELMVVKYNLGEYKRRKSEQGLIKKEIKLFA